MTSDWPATAPAKDRRVRRSRSALMRAAIELVNEQGTAGVAISDIAEAADVSRQVVYQQFGDRDTLLLEAALDLARRELLPSLDDPRHELDPRDGVLAMARHFADHRPFYRAMYTSSSGYALNKALTGLLLPINRKSLQCAYGDALDPDLVEDVARFLTGGVGAFVNTWVVEDEDPLDPKEFADRLLRLGAFAVTAMRPAPTTNEEQGR